MEKEQALIQRIDNTDLINAEFRRLDSLALFCETKESKCVAATIIDDCLTITSNNLFYTSQGNDTEKFIKKTTQYFSDLQDLDDIDFNNSKTMCKHIFEEEIRKLKKLDGLINLSNEEIEDVFNKLWNFCNSSEYNSKHYVKIEDITIADNVDRTPVSILCTEFGIMFNRLKKLEKSCLNSRNIISSKSINWEDKKFIFTHENVEGKKRYTTYDYIWHEDIKKGVHAEMQQLSMIITLIKKGIISNETPTKLKTIYIGISKLCCRSCRAMIDVANTVLKEKGIEIVVRGRHDLKFDNWTIPTLFENGYSLSDDKNIQDIADKIGFLGKQKISSALFAKIIKEGINMYPNISDSVASSSNASQEEFGIKHTHNTDFYSKLLAIQALANSYNKQNIQLSDDIILISFIVTELEKEKSFQGIASNLTSVPDVSILFLEWYKNTKRSLQALPIKKNIEQTLFLAILQNQLLVGQRISDLFSQVKAESVILPGLENASLEITKEAEMKDRFAEVASNNTSSKKEKRKRKEEDTLQEYNAHSRKKIKTADVKDNQADQTGDSFTPLYQTLNSNNASDEDEENIGMEKDNTERKAPDTP